MSLYHIHRPQSLDDIKGNEDTVKSLKKFLNNPNAMPHSYLLHGETGCGKTTIGRVIQNTLNIANEDFIEMNSSEMRGIDTVREIIKNCRYGGFSSDYRIYLVDECHKLTNDAQNAFLKILEDTPSHVIFILCTTEPNKLIPAIKSRCTIYQVQPLSDNIMKRLLKSIARKEKENLDPEVITQIVESAQGRPRAAIQLLDKVFSIDEDQRLEAAKQVLDERNEAIELCRILMNKKSNWKAISELLTNLKSQNEESIRRIVMGYMQSVLLKTDNPLAGLILEEFIEPFYNSGYPGLTYACYSVYKNR